MTPVQRCLHKVDHASAMMDSSVIESVGEALDELEGSYFRPSERVIALEEVYQAFRHRGKMASRSPFARFLLISIERRQNRVSRRAG